jgi:hypothetical protein
MKIESVATTVRFPPPSQAVHVADGPPTHKIPRAIEDLCALGEGQPPHPHLDVPCMATPHGLCRHHPQLPPTPAAARAGVDLGAAGEGDPPGPHLSASGVATTSLDGASLNSSSTHGQSWGRDEQSTPIPQAEGIAEQPTRIAPLVAPSNRDRIAGSHCQITAATCTMAATENPAPIR